MKQILLILSFLLTPYVAGQITPIKVPPVNFRDLNNNSHIDSSLKVIYENPESDLKPAYYVNGILMNSSIIRTLNPKVITGIRIEGDIIEIDSQKYHGRLSITTNPQYQFKLISLTDLKLKYAISKNVPTIFMIDNVLVKEDYDKFILDQNYILRINIEKIENSKENLHFTVIRILTKTKENIRKDNEIRIRGDSALTNK